MGGEIVGSEDGGKSNRSVAIFRFLRRLNDNSDAPFSVSRRFEWPFNINGDEIGRLNTVAESLLDNVLKEPPNFDGNVRFPDLTTRKYDNYKSLIENSANDREPESIDFRWSVFAIGDLGEVIYGSIRISFVTEVPLENQSIGMGDISIAFVSMIIDGSDEEWVQGASNRLMPFIQNAQVALAYRWMKVFRNRWFIEVTKQLVGIFGMATGVFYAGRYLNEAKYTALSQSYEGIRLANPIANKIDRLAHFVIMPPESSIIVAIAPLMMGFILYIFGGLLVVFIVPKLAPRSEIGIGLAGKFRRDRRNQCRLIAVGIFTLIIVPVALHYMGLT